MLNKIFACLWLVVLTVLIYWVAHDSRAQKMHNVIMYAIANYHTACIQYGATFNVDFSDMEHYDKTCRRWWDWGYKRILPKEKFELVKEYIKKKEQKDG